MVVGGVFNLKIDGEIHSADGEFSFEIGGKKYEAQMGSNGKVVGHTSTGLIPGIEGSIYITPNVDPYKIQGAKNAEVILELDNGKTFALSGAYCGSDGKISTSKNIMDIKFHGKDANYF